MSRVLFVVLAEKGHVHPFIGPAQELVRRGHTVGFYSPCDLREPLARAGFDNVFVGSKQAPPPDANRGLAFAQLVADPVRLRAWIRAMLVDTVPLEVQRLGEVVEIFKPDVMVADPMAYAAPIVSAQRGVPWAGVSTSLNPVVPDDWTSELISTTAALPRRQLFADYGVRDAEFRVSDCLSPFVTVTFTTRELVGAPPDGVVLAGASLPLADRGDEGESMALDGRPLVFMALGSQIFHQPRMFEVIIEASRGMGWQLVLAMGSLAGVMPVPGDVQVVGYAPQLELLRRARVMISHGGANSVMEALAYGVPLMISPICNDQPHNARFVTEAGAGVTCDLSRASVAEVRDYLTMLGGEGVVRDRVREISAAYRAVDGAQVVASAVLGLLRGR